MKFDKVIILLKAKGLKNYMYLNYLPQDNILRQIILSIGLKCKTLIMIVYTGVSVSVLPIPRPPRYTYKRGVSVSVQLQWVSVSVQGSRYQYKGHKVI